MNLSLLGMRMGHSGCSPEAPKTRCSLHPTKASQGHLKFPGAESLEAKWMWHQLDSKAHDIFPEMKAPLNCRCGVQLMVQRAGELQWVGNPPLSKVLVSFGPGESWLSSLKHFRGSRPIDHCLLSLIKNILEDTWWATVFGNLNLRLDHGGWRHRSSAERCVGLPESLGSKFLLLHSWDDAYVCLGFLEGKTELGRTSA